MTAITHTIFHGHGSVTIRHISIGRPFFWLARGAADLVACAPGNLGQGLVMVVLGWVLLLMLGRHPYYVAAAVSGFLLVAPITTTGLCELSRLRSAGRPLDFDASLEVLGREGRGLLRFGIVLAVAAVAWFVASEAMLAEVFDLPGQSLADTYYRGFVDTANHAQLMAYLGTGAILALIVFGLSVVTVPVIIDRQFSASQAMHVSLRALVRNPLAMLIWAALLAALTVIGFATLLVGMIVLIPLLGHATWHAYQDLVA